MKDLSGKAFKSFGSKLLLFGEYTLINGSKGLAVPFNAYTLRFSFAEEAGAIEKSTELSLSYLAYLREHKSLSGSYDLTLFENEIKAGLKVISTIPVGYGLGSSGALVAAFFDRYCLNKEWFGDIQKLKVELGLLESYFHGASSGLDPLVSYLDSPVLIESSDACTKIDLPAKALSDFNLFLLNSGMERRTSPLVSIYKEKLEEGYFEKLVKEILIPLNNEIICEFIRGNYFVAHERGRELSELQFSYMPEMIPPSLHTLWSKGLESGDYFLKICGAGGGGFFMGAGKAPVKSEFEILVL